MVPTDRWIVANLDCEGDFGGANPQYQSRWRRAPLRRAALAKLAKLAPLLQVLGPNSRVISALGLPERTSRAPAAILAWGETMAVQALRRRFEMPDPTGDPPPKRSNLADRLWRAPVPSPQAAAVTNHRGFLLETARTLGLDLPGSRLLEEDSELGSALSPDRLPKRALGWVLKAPYSAAGREQRFLLRDGLPVDGEVKSRIREGVGRWGCLLLEPLLRRVADFGCCALVDQRGVEVVSVHCQSISKAGSIRGIRLGASSAPCPGLGQAEHEALSAAAETAGALLSKVGYTGPFGIDSWRFVGEDGAAQFHPLGEINARLTFGFVARCAYEQAVASGRLADGAEANYDLRVDGDFELDPLTPLQGPLPSDERRP